MQLILKINQFAPETSFLYLCILFLCTLISCDNKLDSSESSFDTVRAYYSNGALKYEYTGKDSLKDGYLKRYYPGGQLLATENYREGKLWGEIEYFYENGNFKQKTHYIDDEPFGHAYYYNEDGALRTYSGFDFEGQARYIRKYDAEGKIVQDEGQVLGQLYVTEDDSLRLMFSYAQPPGTKATVKGHIKRDDSTEVSIIPLQKRVGKIVLPYQVDEVRIIGELIDTKTGKLITKDTLYYPDSLYPAIYQMDHEEHLKRR